jgi:hypothetical protein
MTTQLPKPIPMGRPKSLIDDGIYIVKVVGIIEYRTYGNSSKARENAIRYKTKFQWDGPVFNYRYLIQTISQIDQDTGEIKDRTTWPLTMTAAFSIGGSERCLSTQLTQKFDWDRQSDSYNHRNLVGYHLRIEIKKTTNGQTFDFLGSEAVYDIQVPDFIRNMEIVWNEEEDSEIPLECVIPNPRLVQTIQNNQKLSLQIQQEIINDNK